MTNHSLHTGSSWRPFLEVSSFSIFREDIHFVKEGEQGASIEGLRTSLLNSSHISQLQEVAEGKTPVDALQRRFDRGDKCLAVFRGNALVAFSWVTFGWLTFGCYNLQLEDNEAYLFDMYVSPAHRGAGLAGFTRRELYKYLSSQDRSRLISLSLKGNKPAFRFKEKLGARIVDHGVSIKLFNRWRFGTKADGTKVRG